MGENFAGGDLTVFRFDQSGAAAVRAARTGIQQPQPIFFTAICAVGVPKQCGLRAHFSGFLLQKRKGGSERRYAVYICIFRRTIMLLPFFFSFFPFMKGEKKATGSFIFHYDLDDLQFFGGFFVGFFCFFFYYLKG